MLLFVAMVLCVVGLTSAQTKYCCTPSQWESVNIITTGSTVNGGPGKILTGTEVVSVDSKTQMVAVDASLNSSGVPVKLKLIQDFKNSMQYTIQNGGCTKATLGPWEAKCVPDNATFLESSYYGSGNTALPVDIYMFRTGANTVYLNVAKANCIPFSEAVYGSEGGVSAVSTVQFANVTVGIKDPSVFTIPDICKHVPQTGPLRQRISVF